MRPWACTRWLVCPRRTRSACIVVEFLYVTAVHSVCEWILIRRGRDTIVNLKGLRARFEILEELLGFFWQMKAWWLLPLVLILVAFGVILVFAQGSALAPFLYTLF